MANIVEVIIKGVDQATKPLTQPIKSLDDLGKVMTRVGGIIAGTGAATVAAFSAMVAHSIQVADETGKMAQKVGVSTEALSTLAYAGKLSDLSMDQLAMGLKFLSQEMVQLKENGAKGENALRQLGISATDSSGKLRESDDVLLDVAASFAKMEDGAKKTQLAVQLFGRSGLDLIPFLNGGREGIQKLQQEARNLGLEISGVTAKQAEQFNDNLTKLKSTLTGLAMTTASAVLPVLTQFSDSLAKSVTDAETMERRSEQLAFALKLVASAALYAWHAFNLLGQFIAVQIAVWVELFTALGRVWDVIVSGIKNNVQAIQALITAYGSLGDVLSRLVRGDFAGAWDAARESVIGITKETAKLAATTINSTVNAGKSIRDEFSKAWANAKATVSEVYEAMKTDGLAFMQRWEAIWSKATDTANKAKADMNKGGSGDGLAPDTSAWEEYWSLVIQSQQKAKALQQELTIATMTGSEQILEKLRAEYQERIKNIGELEIAEEDSRALKLQAEEEFHAKLTQLYQDSALLRADLEQSLRENDLAGYIEHLNSKMAADQVYNESIRNLANAYHEIWANSLGNVVAAFNNFAANVMRTFSQGFGNAVASVITGAQTASQAFRQLGQQMLSMLISFIAQLIINTAIAKALQTAMSAATLAAIAPISSGWAAAATAASIATLGAATAAGAGVIPLMVANAGMAKALTLSGVAHSGLDFVPNTGTYLLERGEAVLQPKGNPAITEHLEGQGKMTRIELTVDGRVFGEVIADLSRDGRIHIHPRALVA